MPDGSTANRGEAEENASKPRGSRGAAALLRFVRDPVGRLAASAPLRLAALFLALFVLAAGLAFAAAVVIVRAEVLDGVRADILARGDALVVRLAAELPAIALGPQEGDRVSALFSAGGQRLAGWSGLQPVEGWARLDADDLDLRERSRGRDLPETVLAHGRALPDGRLLVVAGGAGVVDEVVEDLVVALLWSLLAVAALAALGASFLAWRTRARLSGMERALARYGAGDLDQRLPVRGGVADDLDRMAGAVNAALARVETLVGAIRQVTTDAAHDLKTPMTRLRNRLEEAERGAADPTSGFDPTDTLARARREADAVIDTFEALLRIAQVEGGDARERFGPVDLSDVLDAVADAYGPDAEEAGGSLATAIEPGLAVVGDRDLLTQAFANLVENAIRHGGGSVTVGGRMSPAGRGSAPARGTGAPPSDGISFEAAATGGAGSESEGTVEAWVADAGGGVPMAERTRVLERFVRLEASRTTPGTGLGLSLVRAIADLHGATLTLSDTDPGAEPPGLRVRLAFPRVAVLRSIDPDDPSAGTAPSGTAGRTRANLSTEWE